MLYNYEQLLEKIAVASGVVKEELERRVEAKRAKLSGLVSKEGAAQIIANELGINFEKQKLKINELLSGMRNINFVGKIIRVFPIRTFNKNGREGRVVNMIIADETGNVRVVLWDTNHIALVENKEIKEGDVVSVARASVRESEVHLTGFSDIKASAEMIENVKTERVYVEKALAGARVGEALRARAFLVQIFEPRFFEVCPECGKKIEKQADGGAACLSHGIIVPVKRSLITAVLDDGTENMRAVLFQEQIEKLGLDVNAEDFVAHRQGFVGREAFFSGSIRNNKFFNTPEFFVENVEAMDIDKIIDEMEKKG